MNYLLLVSLLFLGACATTPHKPPAEPSPVIVDTKESYEQPRIDYERLQIHLKLNRPVENLGYVEKPFSTCEVGFGYPSNRDCRMDYFVVIHFQLMCRHSSQDTHYSALEAADMQPIKHQTLKWSLNSSSGELFLDELGYGQIKMTFKHSMRAQRLKLNVGNENLYIKSGDIRRVVTPSDWCAY